MLLGLRVGDPYDEVAGAWLAKESVRDVYLVDDPADAAIPPLRPLPAPLPPPRRRRHLAQPAHTTPHPNTAIPTRMRRARKGQKPRLTWDLSSWALTDSNRRPLPCKGTGLPKVGSPSRITE
jgi:hypothetical protein